MKNITTLAFLLVATAGVGQTTIRVETRDVDNFWRAFDRFEQDTTTNPFIEYVSEGTQHLKDFAPYRFENADTLKKIIREHISHYRAIRNQRFDFKNVAIETQPYFDSLRKIYPPATLPEIVAVVGAGNSGIGITQNAVIIGTELFSDSTFKSSFGFGPIRPERLPVLLASGIVYHNNRPAPTGYDLLRQSIVQGSVDFITTLIVGEKKSMIFERDHYKYGESHEEAVMKEFLRDLELGELSRWLYNRDEPGWPGNLGEWVGYKITEAYYNNSVDKKKAIREILTINDFRRFLQLSGYADHFRY